MRTIFRNIFLFIAVISSLLLTACGGGSSDNIPTNPVAPTNTLSDEALAVRNVVSPVLQNADAILYGNGVSASSRTSTSGNEKKLSNNEIGNAVIKTLETPQLLRAVITAAGGNINGGLWYNEKEGSGYCEVATFSNGIYERSVYNIDKDFISQLSTEDLKKYLVSHCVLDGCEADLRKGILYGITVKPNAKISVECQPNSNHKQLYYSFKGTLNTDLTIKWVEPNVEKYESTTFVVDYNGKDVTNSETDHRGLKVSEKTTCKTAYSFSNIDLNLTEISYIDYKHNNNPNIKEYKGNLNISLSGMDGTLTHNYTTFLGTWAYKQEDQWVISQQPYYSDNDFKVVAPEYKPDFILNAPFKITLSGDVYDAYVDNGEKINTANIKNVSVIINKLTKPSSGKLEDYIIDDAEAQVELEASMVDISLFIGNHEVAFNKANIYITGLKYAYEWEPVSEKRIWIEQQSPYGWMWTTSVENEEYRKEVNEMNRKCFGNAKATIEAEESKNNVIIKGKCDINTKTALLNLVNNGNYIVKDNSSKDNILEFNFKTVDINGINVDILADNNCEGAILKVKGVEKDGTVSERTYEVENGKLVLVSSKDKLVPNLPDVVIPPLPEGLSNDSNSIEVAVSEGNLTNDLKMKDSDESLKVGQNGDLIVASYGKKPKNGKKIETKISAKGRIITAVSFFGENVYTLVFVIDCSEAKNIQIKGSIFQGKRENVNIDSVENRIGQFAGKNGNITVITSEGASEFSIH